MYTAGCSVHNHEDLSIIPRENMVVHHYNPNTGQADAHRSLEFTDPPT